MASTSKSPASRAKRKSRTLAFPVEFRLRIVKLYLEERYSPKLLVEQFGISTHSIQRWVKAFRLHGAQGLEPKRPVSRQSRVELAPCGGCVIHTPESHEGLSQHRRYQCQAEG